MNIHDSDGENIVIQNDSNGSESIGARTAPRAGFTKPIREKPALTLEFFLNFFN